MGFSQKIVEIQNSLKDQSIQGWLLYDYHGSNSLACSFLEIPPDKFLTRRFYYWIPQNGEAVKIVSAIEANALDHLPGEKWVYCTWQELEKYLFSISVEHATIAMEFSPDNSLPIISKVDAGTIDLLRKGGAEIVSSANLLQKYTSVWSEKQLQSHLLAEKVLCQTVDKAWQFIANKLKSNLVVTEYDVQQFMLQEITSQNCTMDHPPICAVNANSANPHYGPEKTGSAVIRQGDFILLDLWCKSNEPNSVYADITRVGVAATKATKEQEEIFQIVKEARDEVTQYIRAQHEQGELIQGWMADQVCRDAIIKAGYGEFFIHRTGHNIGEIVHGSGANLDNYETHDFRQLLPGTCFSVEPGIYLPGRFGVRLEYDVYLDTNQIRITGGIQEKIVILE